jgi:hypothetical protein
MKLKIFLTLTCVIIFFISVSSQPSSNCIQKSCKVNSNGAQGCNISYEYKDCNGRSHFANPVCTNGSGGQSSCQCSCIPPPDNGWVISYSLPDDSNVSEAKRCLGCPTPTPTPTPCPTPNTPAPSANCNWDSQYCTWNCDYAGGCTTPGWDGSCPYGTYPNNGMCCTGGCSGATVAPGRTSIHAAKDIA